MTRMQLADMVAARAAEGMNYGVVLLPEGLIEFVPEVGHLIAEINELLARDIPADVTSVALKLTPASRQVPQLLSSIITGHCHVQHCTPPNLEKRLSLACKK